MEPEAFIRIGQQLLLMVLVISGPPVLAALIVGLMVSLFQAATQLQEQTLTFVPKIVVIVVVLALCGHWLLRQLLEFSIGIFNLIPDVSH